VGAQACAHMCKCSFEEKQKLEHKIEFTDRLHPMTKHEIISHKHTQSFSKILSKTIFSYKYISVY